MIYLRSLDDQIIIQIEEGQTLLVGRLPKCDIVLEDSSVSSQHAQLHLADNKLRVVDTGSTNGTRVNYAAIDGQAYLLDGDTVEFGKVSFTIDGASLQSPASESKAMAAIVDLEPLEASQALSDTMLSIPLPPEQELEDMIEDPQQVTPPPEDDELPEVVMLSPDMISFRIALGLLLLGGLILIALIWLRPYTL